MMAKRKHKLDLDTLVRSLGGAPSRGAQTSLDLESEALEVGAKIHRETMRGKIKLTGYCDTPDRTEQERAAVVAWLPHRPGDPMPVEPRTRVVCRLRHGALTKAAMAKGRDWRSMPGCPSYEIIEYRLAGAHHAE